MRPTASGFVTESVEEAIDTVLAHDLKAKAVNPSPPKPLVYGYRDLEKLGFAPKYLNERGLVDRDLGQTLAIVKNGLCVVHCAEGVPDKCTYDPEWIHAPLFIESDGAATCLFRGLGFGYLADILGFTIESLRPCPPGFERSFERYLPLNDVSWIRPPRARKEKLPPVPDMLWREIMRQNGD